MVTIKFNHIFRVDFYWNFVKNKFVRCVVVVFLLIFQLFIQLLIINQLYILVTFKVTMVKTVCTRIIIWTVVFFNLQGIKVIFMYRCWLPTQHKWKEARASTQYFCFYFLSCRLKFKVNIPSFDTNECSLVKKKWRYDTYLKTFMHTAEIVISSTLWASG